MEEAGRKEAEKKRRARKRGPAARTSSPPRTRIERARRRPLYVVKVGPCSCRKAATLVGCIIPLRARDTTTLPLCSSTAAALLPRGVNKDERIARARARARACSPEASSLNPIDSHGEGRMGIPRIKSGSHFCLGDETRSSLKRLRAGATAKNWRKKLEGKWNSNFAVPKKKR